MGFLDLAIQNLMSPMVLFFALGAAAAFARSDLMVPEAVARFLSLYLLMAIGFKGGAEVAHSGLTPQVMGALGMGILLSAVTPIVAYALLRGGTKLSPLDAASVAGHYGSISAVTFAAITGVLNHMSVPYEGYMAAVAAAMETPAIFTALAIAQRSGAIKQAGHGTGLLREVALNGSIVMLLGSFLIGSITGARGLTMLKPFLVDPFAGFLCLFLLDMGLLAGRGLLRGWRILSFPVIVFGVAMPITGALLAGGLAAILGLSMGGAAYFHHPCGLSLLYRGARRDAHRLARGQSSHRAHPVPRGDLPIQPDAGHTHLHRVGVSHHRLNQEAKKYENISKETN